MNKYLLISSFLIGLFIGCFDDGTKDSNASTSCPTCEVCTVCETCDDCTPISGPVITSISVGGTDISVTNGRTVSAGAYDVSVNCSKQVTHNMDSDGTKRGIFVARLKDAGGFERMTIDPTISAWWENLGGQGIGFQWVLINHGTTPFQPGHYIVVVILGDEDITTHAAMWYQL